MQQFDAELSLKIDGLHCKIERIKYTESGLFSVIRLWFLRWQLRKLERKIPV